MERLFLCLVFLLQWMLTSAQPDPSVCTTAAFPVPPPPPALADLYTAVVEWTERETSTTYVTTDSYDTQQMLAGLHIARPLQSDVTLLFDFNSATYSVIQAQQPVPACVSTSSDQFFYYEDKPWLAPMMLLYKNMIGTKAVLYGGTDRARDYSVNKWSSCLYYYQQNVTAAVDFLFTDQSWLVPLLPPHSSVPVQIRMAGKRNHGNITTTFNVTGEIINYAPDPIFPVDAFVPPDGVFCNGRSNSLAFPQMETQVSMVLEVIDTSFHTITYKQVWYDFSKSLVRVDTKDAADSDSDPTTTILDFQTGLQYKMDAYLGTCEVSRLQAGDDFVGMDDGHIYLLGIGQFLHFQFANLQYVGKKETRGVLCDVWVGYYYDEDDVRNVTVQWYFTARGWREAVDTVVAPGTFFRMDVWTGDKPTIHHIHQYVPTPPALRSFNVGPCYSEAKKIHFLLEFNITDTKGYQGISQTFLLDDLHQQLVNQLNVSVLRLTDLQLQDDGASTLYMSGSLLDVPPLVNTQVAPQPEHALLPAFNFMSGLVLSAIPVLVQSSDGSPVPLITQRISKLDYPGFFTTTSTSSAPSTTFLIPTLPPITSAPTPRTPPTQRKTPSLITPPTSPSPKVTTRRPTPSSTAVATAASIASMTPCICPSPRPCTCPKVTCPVQRPCNCPTSSCPPTRPPPVCPTLPPSPSVTSASPCPASRSQQTGSDSTPYSAGVLGGAMVAMLVLGLLLGFVATRIYHVKARKDPMLANLVTDDSSHY